MGNGKIRLTFDAGRTGIIRAEIRNAYLGPIPLDPIDVFPTYEEVLFLDPPVATNQGEFHIVVPGQLIGSAPRGGIEIDGAFTSDVEGSGTAQLVGDLCGTCQPVAWHIDGPVDVPPAANDRQIDGHFTSGGSLTVTFDQTTGYVTSFAVEGAALPPVLRRTTFWILPTSWSLRSRFSIILGIRMDCR